jgi:hypothetical protein
MPKADSTSTSDATAALEPSSKKRGKEKKQAKVEKTARSPKTDGSSGDAKTKDASRKSDKPKDKKKAASGEPTFKYVAKKKLSTGKGATPAEIGRSLVQLFNAGKADDVSRLWHHKKIESIEGDGMVFLGRKGVEEKNAWWYGAYEMHAALAEGPYVGATGFTVHFAISVTPRAGGERMDFREVGVYTVEKGKIVREEFMGLQPG